VGTAVELQATKLSPAAAQATKLRGEEKMLLQSISTDSSSLVSQFEHIAAIVVASGGLVPKHWLVQCMV
jgi:hypothetical protein